MRDELLASIAHSVSELYDGKEVGLADICAFLQRGPLTFEQMTDNELACVAAALKVMIERKL